MQASMEQYYNQRLPDRRQEAVEGGDPKSRFVYYRNWRRHVESRGERIGFIDVQDHTRNDKIS